MMQHILNYYPTDLNDSEIKHCEILLSKDEHYRTTKLDRLEEAFDTAQQNLRDQNQRELVTGVT